MKTAELTNSVEVDETFFLTFGNVNFVVYYFFWCFQCQIRLCEDVTAFGLWRMNRNGFRIIKRKRLSSGTLFTTMSKQISQKRSSGFLSPKVVTILACSTVLNHSKSANFHRKSANLLFYKHFYNV